MRFPRMTTRRWMVVVAVVAMSAGAARLNQQARAYKRLAVSHSEDAKAWRESADDMMVSSFFVIEDGRMLNPVEQAHFRGQWLKPSLANASYHEALAHKYERAARYPWLPVEPDPPEPK